MADLFDIAVARKLSGGGGNDVGYKCTETKESLFDGSITTVEDSGYVEGDLGITVDADALTVTMDGTEYSCERDGDGGYGAPYDGTNYDWSVYPFYIFNNSYFGTETAGTYSVKIETIDSEVETTLCFKAAVKSVVGEEDAPQALFVTLYGNGEVSHTPTEIYDAYSQGIPVVFEREGENSLFNPSMISFQNSMIDGKETVGFSIQHFDYLDSSSVRLSTTSYIINRNKTYTNEDHTYKITGLTIETLS